MLNKLISLEKKITTNFLTFSDKEFLIKEELQKIDIFYSIFKEEAFNEIYTEFEKENNINIFKYGSYPILALFMTKHFILSINTFDKNDVFAQYFNEEWKMSKNLIYDSSEMIEKLLIYMAISKQINVNVINNKNKKKIKSMIFSATENLIIAKKIEEKKILIESKTIKFLKRKNIINVINDDFFYKTNSNIFILNEAPYFINNTYSSVQEVHRKNIFNPFSSYPSIEQLQFILKLQNLKLFPNIHLLEESVKEILEKTNLSEEWLRENWWKIEEIEKIKKIPENFKKENYPELNESSKKRFNTKKNIQKKISTYMGYKDIIDFKNKYHELKNGFYLTYYTDFRLRIYSKGQNSPTNNKIIRHCINYGNYTTIELNIIENEVENSKSWKFIKNYEKMLTQLLHLKNTYKNYEIAGIFWCLLELGKLKKEEILVNGSITTDSFIKKGIEIFENNYKFEKEKNLIHLNCKKIIENIIEKKQWKKDIIFKDATASVIQHLLKILGAKDELSTKYCNFSDNNAWWDPYYFVISEYTKNSNDASLKNFMTREIWKPLILTFHYSVTLHTGINYVMENLRDNEEFKGLSEDNKNIIEKKMINEIKNFFNFLNDFFNKNIFFEQNSNILIKNWNEDLKFIETHDKNSIYLNYYNIKEKRLNITNSLSQRKTLKYNEIVEEYDKKQTLRALRANIIHASDAQYARLLINKYKILAIHDSFGIDIFRISQFIDDANLLLKIELAKTSFATNTVSIDSDLYSIFALL